MSDNSRSTEDFSGAADTQFAPAIAGTAETAGEQSRSRQTFPMDCACQASLRGLRQKCLTRAENLRDLEVDTTARAFELCAEWTDEIIDKNRTLVVSYKTAAAISEWSYGRIKNKTSDNSDPLENLGTSGNGMARVCVSDLPLTRKFAAMPHEELRDEIERLESGDSGPEEVVEPREKAAPPRKRETEKRENKIVDFKRGSKRSVETSSNDRLQLNQMLAGQ